MKDDPLRIISVEKGIPHPKHTMNRSDPRLARIKAARDTFERRWQEDPNQFNPTLTAIERERIERSWNVLQPLVQPGMPASDLGCGWGVLSERIAERGGSVDALDIASSALERLRPHAHERIRLLCDAAPMTQLPDDHYSIVVCTDLIAELPSPEHRLLISELYRIAKPEGHILCSTPLDIHSDGALERFASLVETELEPENWLLSHHAYYLRLRHLLNAPARYHQAMIDLEYYKKQRAKAGLFGRGWLWLNSRKPLGYFWKILSTLLKPVLHAYDQSRTLLLKMESLCRFLSPDDGISHVLIVARLKSLKTTQDVDVQAMSRPVQRLRQRIWE